MKAILFFWNLIGGCLHELTHVAMALLLYPFKSRIVGFGIKPSEDGESWSEMYVATYAKYPACAMLVAAAPTLLYWPGMIALLWSEHYVTYGFFLIFFHKFSQMSPTDAANFCSEWKKTALYRLFHRPGEDAPVIVLNTEGEEKDAQA